MTEIPQEKESHETKQDATKGPLIHRVCISCNNMFVVSLDNYEAKHCPTCHKA